MESRRAKRTTSRAVARPLAIALQAAVVMLLALGTPVLAGDPGNGNGNGNANGNGNGGGPDRTETPGNGNDRKPTPEPQTPEPTVAPIPEPTVAALPPATSVPVAPAQPAAPPAATAAAPVRTPVPAPATSAPAAGKASGQAGSVPRTSNGGEAATGQRAPVSAAGTAASPRAARPAAPTADAREGGGTRLGSLPSDVDAPVLPALAVVVAVASTAGGMVLVGRRRGDPAAEPAVVPIGLTPVPDVVPASDPLLAALQGSARFAPPDGTTTASGRATHGDGAPLWVRRLEPRIPVLASLAPAQPARDALEPELEDAAGF